VGLPGPARAQFYEEPDLPVAELWELFDELYAEKMWARACDTLGKLTAKGEQLKRVAGKAGYAYLRCAAAHLKDKKFTETTEFLDLAKVLMGAGHADIKPVEGELYRALAAMALEQKRLSQALEFLEKAAVAYPDEGKDQDASLALVKYAQARHDEHNAEETAEALKAALQYYPQNREALRLKEEAEAARTRPYYLVGGMLALILVALFVLFGRRD
jgi:tetratricopeptide (TPR) repeat protein